jgi:hypothetical protein
MIGSSRLSLIRMSYAFIVLFDNQGLSPGFSVGLPLTTDN